MEKNTEIVKGLCQLLASTYTLYLKTQNFHWNVKGHFFRTLHMMFEEQYTQLALANDTIAERIRSLGEPAPGTFQEFAELSFVKEPQGVPVADDMVADLVQSHESIIEFARDLISKAQDAGDEGTADMLTSRIVEQEKTVWMLKSFINQ